MLYTEGAKAPFGLPLKGEKSGYTNTESISPERSIFYYNQGYAST